MEVLDLLAAGFAAALTPRNLGYCLLGVVWGTIVGILPGLGPLAGMTLLLPLTFKLTPDSAVIMLAGIFYGAMYGGSLTSILVRIPGEAASVMTCIDGHEMTKQGRAGPAIAIAAVGSWVGGTLSVVGLMFFAPPLAAAMLRIGPAEEFVILLLAFLVMVLVSQSSPLKTLTMVLLGLLIAAIGLDPMSGHPRFTAGSPRLVDGISFVALALGLFGVSEIFLSLERIVELRPQRPSLQSLVPQLQDLRDSAGAVGRGTVIGFVFGLIPGVSHIISTFVSYVVERRLSRHPERFGHGAIQGVAGPETANNATTGSAMVPLLVLGIPANPVTAILLSAFLIHGIQPGPQLIGEHPAIFWSLIASMMVGNLILLILNLPLVGLFINVLRVPYGYLAPAILLISMVGVYGVAASTLDLWVLLLFGAAGYLLRKLDFDVAPLLLATVLGDRLETAFRRALSIAEGDYRVFFHGLNAALLIGAVVVLAGVLGFARLANYRRERIVECG